MHCEGGGGEDETPAYGVATRIRISKERQAKRASMSKEERNTANEFQAYRLLAETLGRM